MKGLFDWLPPLASIALCMLAVTACDEHRHVPSHSDRADVWLELHQAMESIFNKCQLEMLAKVKLGLDHHIDVDDNGIADLEEVAITKTAMNLRYLKNSECLHAPAKMVVGSGTLGITPLSSGTLTMQNPVFPLPDLGEVTLSMGEDPLFQRNGENPHADIECPSAKYPRLNIKSCEKHHCKIECIP